MFTHRQSSPVQRPRSFSLCGLIVAVLFAFVGVAQAQELSILSSFSAAGTTPESTLVRDGSGNSYGVTSSGGTAGHGTIYKVAADGTATILHSFGAAPVTYGSSTTTDGTVPSGNLILATDGNLYGTTADGGASFGTVYRVSTTGSYAVIYIFAAQNSIAFPAAQNSAGVFPESGVIQGLDGNLYGTAAEGGSNGTGAVFQLSLDGSTYTVLHNFAATDSTTGTTIDDAANPYFGLVQDAQGNFYGTTTHGGSANAGAIFEINNQGQYAVIYNFPATSTSFTFTQATTYTLQQAGNYSPNSALVMGADGNLYGTLSSYTVGSGAIYKVTPQGGLTLLHQFGDGTVAGDGAEPKFVNGSQAAFVAPPQANAMIVGADQKLYGTTPLGGSGNNGVIFQLTISGQYSIVHTFGDGSVTQDGAQPVGITQGSDGNFYGTTALGGVSGKGTIFELTNALPGFLTPLHVTAALGVPFTYHMAGTQGPDTFTVSGLPSGFTFDGTNTVSATPAVAGTFTLTLTATNSAGSNTAPLVITVMPTPVISSLLTSVGTTSGVPYQIFATNSPTSFAATGLPSGVTANAFNGQFVGTPATAGTYHVTISASNAAGTGTASLTLQILSAAPTASQEYSQLRSFNDGSVSGEGTFPGAMIKGNDGSFYGVTAQGGVGGGGTVFNLLPSGVTRVIASFNGTNGSAPQGVLQASDGTLYGTTQAGGTANLGVIFKIATDGTLTVLHSFGDNTVANDGANPQAGLVLNSDGNYYGTTQNGGSASKGAVFKMTPAGAVTTIHSFGDGTVTNDGAQPVAALTATTGFVVVTNGTPTLYPLVGTTLRGGTQDVGTLFAISTSGQVYIAHSFGTVTNDGQLPHGSVRYLLPGTGTLTNTAPEFYGTTTAGGSLGKGTIYGFALNGTMTILHSFGDGTVANDGENPISSLVAVPPSTVGGLVGAGSANIINPVLCGTTQNGGLYGSGAVFTCSFTATNGVPGPITTAILHNFGDPTVMNDGVTPLGGGLVIGVDNNVYGTTMSGGNSYGTAFALQTNQTIFSSGQVNLTNWSYSGTLPAGMSFDSTTGTLLGIPSSMAALGTYSITIYSNSGNNSSGTGNDGGGAVIIVNGGGTSFSQTLTFKLAQTFATWANLHAVTSIVSSGSTGAPADGVPMALKYLFDISNPGQPTSVADHAAMPTMMEDNTSVPNTPYIALSYRQYVGLTGMDVGLESSDDMVTWSPVTGTSLLKKQTGTDNTTGDPIMEMGTPMGSSPHQFLRLIVTPQ